MPQSEGRKIYSVSELNREIKAVLEDTYPDIWVEAEISGLKTYSSGHTYFFLKDGDSQISAVIFRGAGDTIKFSFEEGLKVIVRGRVTAYPKRGDYQIIVKYAEPAGIGALQLAFEQLKARLHSEGLFDEARKRKIPLLVQRLGIVTSPDGAALSDILTVINRRFANVEITIYPVRVQGEEAKHEIAAAIEYLNSNYPGLDVLLVGRGGGSYQDLWAFNEEVVARAIYRSKIPVISCVGHEVDFTIADFVADLRAPTPSAAAELVVRNKSELAGTLETLRGRLAVNIENRLAALKSALGNLAGSRVLEKPEAIFEIKMQDLDGLSRALQGSVEGILSAAERTFAHCSEKLSLVSPLNVLSRGYAICSRADSGSIVKDSAGLRPGDPVNIKLFRGGFKGAVKEIIPAEEPQ